MGAFRSIRRTPLSRNVLRDTANTSAPAHAPAEPTDPARVVTLDDGTRWLATVVARLVSEDMLIGQGSARLLVRLESLTRSRASSAGRDGACPGASFGG